MTHVLKSWCEYYFKIKCGLLTSNIRKDDRPFKDGDDILFKEYDHKRKVYTGHTCKAKLLSVQRDVVGLMPGYCVLSINVGPDSNRFILEEVNTAG